ncbi:MAG: phage terminase large subunit [Paraclostridium sp.]
MHILKDDSHREVLHMRVMLSKGDPIIKMANALGAMICIHPLRVLDTLKSQENLVSMIRGVILYQDSIFFKENKAHLYGQETLVTDVIRDDDLLHIGSKKTVHRIHRSLAEAYFSCGALTSDSGNSSQLTLDQDGVSLLSAPKVSSFNGLIADAFFKKLYEKFTQEQMMTFRSIIDDQKNNIHLLLGVAGGGKSVLASCLFSYFLNQMYIEGLKEGVVDHTVVLMGKTISSIHNTSLHTLSKFFGIRAPNRTYPYLKIGSVTISILSLDSASSIENLRGSNVSLLWIDEATSMRQNDLLQVISRLRCQYGTFKSKLLLTANYSTTSSVPCYIQQHKDDILASVHVLSPKNNPFLPAEYVQRIEGAISDKNSIAYRMHVLGEHTDVSAGYLNVYNLRPNHVVSIDKEVPLKSHSSFAHVWIGCDYGNTNPRVFVAISVHEDVMTNKQYVQVRDVLYHKQFHASTTTRQEYDDLFHAFVTKFIISCPVTVIFPHDCVDLYFHYKRRYDKVEFQHKLRIIKTACRPVNEGIARIRYLLINNHITIIEDTCQELIDEFHKYSYAPSQMTNQEFDLKAKDELKPVKQHDHCLDALRYAIDECGIFTKLVSAKEEYNTEEKLIKMLMDGGYG